MVFEEYRRAANLITCFIVSSEESAGRKLKIKKNEIILDRKKGNMRRLFVFASRHNVRGINSSLMFIKNNKF